jgi:hypothetical protein
MLNIESKELSMMSDGTLDENNLIENNSMEPECMILKY